VALTAKAKILVRLAIFACAGLAQPVLLGSVLAWGHRSGAVVLREPTVGLGDGQQTTILEALSL
jgi:hypothetical protein